MHDSTTLNSAYARDRLWLTLQRFGIAGRMPSLFEWNMSDMLKKWPKNTV